VIRAARGSTRTVKILSGLLFYVIVMTFAVALVLITSGCRPTS
jgi:hypothetical protein